MPRLHAYVHRGRGRTPRPCGVYLFYRWVLFGYMFTYLCVPVAASGRKTLASAKRLLAKVTLNVACHYLDIAGN